MSSADQWLPVILFLVLMLACVGVEIAVLVRLRWATAGRSAAYVLVTDILSISIFAIIWLGTLFGLFVMVMGPAGTGSNAPEAAYIAALVLGILAPLLLTFIVKLGFLYFLKIRSGRSALLYSAAVSLAVPAITFGAPAILGYLLTIRS